MICSVPMERLQDFFAADDGKKPEKEAKKEAQGEYGAVLCPFDNEEIGSGTSRGGFHLPFRCYPVYLWTHWN